MKRNQEEPTVADSLRWATRSGCIGPGDMIVDVVGELDEGYRSAALGGLFVLFCWPENVLVAAIYTTPETGIFFWHPLGSTFE